MEIVAGEPTPSGELNTRGVAKLFWTYRRLYLGNGARYEVS